MLHPESVLALVRQVGRVDERVTHARHARRVAHLPLKVLEDQRLLRLRHLPVCLVVGWPVELSVVVSRFTVGEFRDAGHRAHGKPRPLQRVRRGDAVDDRRLVVTRHVRHRLLTASGRAPVSENSNQEPVDESETYTSPGISSNLNSSLLSTSKIRAKFKTRFTAL